MKPILFFTSLLILTITLGCQSTTKHGSVSPSNQPEPDYNLLLAPKYVNALSEYIYKPASATPAILGTISPEALSTIQKFREQSTKQFAGNFQDFSLQDFNVYKNKDNEYIAKAIIYANIGRTIIISNYQYVIEMNGAENVTLKQILIRSKIENIQ